MALASWAGAGLCCAKAVAESASAAADATLIMRPRIIGPLRGCLGPRHIPRRITGGRRRRARNFWNIKVKKCRAKAAATPILTTTTLRLRFEAFGDSYVAVRLANPILDMCS